MAISGKTRKTLWGRAGNRCAMCRAELVAEKNEHNKNLNIGDECHIISESPSGPRHDPGYQKDFDDYENLILLCKNHHRTIDELYETYSVTILRSLKEKHELWAKSALDAAAGRVKRPKILNRITSGKQMVDIINEVELYYFDHDELTTQEEVDLIGGFIQNLKDWGDLSGMGGMEHSQLVQLGFDLNSEIKTIEERGFSVFGERSSRKMTNSKKEDLGVLSAATVLVLRKNNPAIVEDKVQVQT